MNLQKLFCTNCGAQLDLDLDNLIAYCPYCGQKLLIDFDQIGDVIREKEQTKRSTFAEEEQTKRMKTEFETEIHKKEIDANEESAKRKYSLFRIFIPMIWIVFGLLVTFGVIAIGLGEDRKKEKVHIANNEIQLGFSYDDVEEKYYEDVVERFRSLGLTNIETIPEEMTSQSKKGTVAMVTVAGDDKFYSSDWFPITAKVVIRYYSNEGQ